MSMIGTVDSLWRYPVKSMRGEELNALWDEKRPGDLLSQSSGALTRLRPGVRSRRWHRMSVCAGAKNARESASAYFGC
jgi:hypothetical protein